MIKFLKSDLAAAAAILIISLFYWAGVPGVPFHPDESTQIFMSADFKTALTRLEDLFWSTTESSDPRMFYRQIDPPLTRYLIGAGLAISGESPLPRDWDWGESMEENQTAGSFPSIRQLLVARLAVASLFPFSLFFAYLIGKKLRSRSLGWLNMILLAVNALALLHTRRAMAESALLAGALFTLWGVVSWERRRFWLALPAALAFNAKYSALPLALIGLVAVLWDFPSWRTSVRVKLIHSIAYVAIFIATTALLNPFLWRAPIPALQDAFAKREALLQAQSEEFSKAGERFVLDTPGEKGLTLLAQLFYAPPAIQDVENYVEDLAPAAEKYLANPIHRLFTGRVGGSLISIFSLAGLALLSLRIYRAKPAWRAGILLLAAFLLQLGGILMMIRFPFQRYYLPLIPYLAIFAAFFLNSTVDLLISSRQGRIKREIP